MCQFVDSVKSLCPALPNSKPWQYIYANYYHKPTLEYTALI